MPELPEVETITRQLRDVIIGKTIRKVTVYREKSFRGTPSILEGKTISTVKRQAKIIRIQFGADFPVLLIHLKMTGQLIYTYGNKRIAGGHPTADWINTLPGKHTRVEIDFTDKSTLFFNDMRVFGWLKLVKSPKALDAELKGFGGLEPLDQQFTPESLARAIGKSHKAIKLVILDQSVVAGLGNIYANDALYDAGIDPRREANTLTAKEINRLHHSIVKVVALGIKYGGATQSDYRQLTGVGGHYQDHFLVYKQEGKTCGKCGTKIEKFKLGGRGTYICPHCQK